MKRTIALCMAILLLVTTPMEMIAGEISSASVSKDLEAETKREVISLDLTDYIVKNGGFLTDNGVATFNTRRTVINDVANVKQEIATSIENVESSVDLADYEVPAEIVSELVVEVANENPKFYYVDYSNVECTVEDDVVTEVTFAYEDSETAIKASLNEYETEINKILSGVSSKWSDFEKILYLNDYLTENCKYDTTYSKYDAYNIIVEKTGVCQAYAEAFQDLASRLGITCYMITSYSLNHAWNFVLLNGKYYHVDVTWNDPVPDRFAMSRHEYLLKSTEYFKYEGGHWAGDDWTIRGGLSYTLANDTSYDNYFWNNVDMPFKYVNGRWYTIPDSDTKIMSYACNGKKLTDAKALLTLDYRWHLIGEHEGGYWIGYFGGFGAYGNEVFYAAPKTIYAYNVTTKNTREVYALISSEAASGHIYGIKVSPAGDIQYNVATEPGKKGKINKLASYHISLLGNGSTSGSTKTIKNCKYGQSYTLPKNSFKRTGYMFVEWNTKADGSGKSYKNGAIVSNLTKTDGKTIKLYAQWKKNTYTITYKLNDGAFKEGQEIVEKYTVTTADFKLPKPTRKNYQFAGWYTEKDFKNKVTTIKKGTTGNKTLYAKWTKNKYSIGFHSNGGTGSTKDISDIAYNKEVTLTANGFKKSGYSFKGWNTKADGSGTSYKNKETVKGLTTTNGKKITLYAQWKANTYTIKFEANGGKTADGKAIESIKYKITSETFTLPKPVKKGYTFGGWYTDKKFNSKTKVSKIEKGSTGSKTLYAKWTANKYTVTFDDNTDKLVGKVSGSTKNQSLTYAKSTALTKNGYKINGYTFKGWATTPDGAVKYKDGEKVKNLSSKSNGKVTLYAVWSPKSYTITYKDGGTHENPAKYNIESKTITLKKPTKNGYTFVGWYKDSKFTKKVTKIASGTTGNQTLYAKWTANKYKIKFDPNEASLKCTSKVTATMSKKTMTYSKSAKLTKNVYKASGYTFTGWATTPNGKVKYKDGAEVKNLTSKKDGTVTLYAVWKLKDTSKKPVAKYHNYKWVTDGETRTMTCSGCGKTGVTEYKYGELWGYYDDAAAVELMSHVNEQRKITTYTVQDRGVTIAIENVKPLIVDEKLTEKAKKRALEAAREFSHGSEEHECLAWGQGSSLEAFRAWYHSDSHRNAMLSETYVTGGTACFYYDSDNSGTNLTPIWVLELGYE